VALALFGVCRALDCSFSEIYPRQYIVYKAEDSDFDLDGKLDEAAWESVPFTADFVDINTTTVPHFRTSAKIRYTDNYLYIGAVLQETAVWGNISWTCHCLNSSQDQVIFHDNDFEIFTDPDGSTHYYKEFEMNVNSATWDLCLDKPYWDSGNENSSRVFGQHGFDMQHMHSSMKAQAFTDGGINDPARPATFWSVEVALPLHGLAVNNSVTVPPKPGQFWRINFSRVEWNTKVVNGKYQKDPKCQSCPVPGGPHEDNWVWSPQGVVDMHRPERWGMLQFSESKPNATKPVRNPEWTVGGMCAVPISG